MTTFQIQSPAADPIDSIRWERLAFIERRLVAFGLPRPAIDTSDPAVTVITFTPDLTAPQEALVRRLIAFSGFLQITPAEWAAIEGDIDNARAYLNVASPTLAQTAGMVKGIVRVLRVLLRD